MNGFEKRASQIKAKIMRTTLDMLKTTDPKGIRIADISKAAGVSQVTIYNYFGSKEALLRDVFKSFVDAQISEFEAYMNEGHSLKEKIAHILFREKEVYGEFSPRIIRELLQEDEELMRYIEAQYAEKAIPLTVRIIEEGKASGEISADISTESVLCLMQLYMNQYELILEMAARSGDMDKFLENFVHMFFYGICGRPEA